MPFVSAGLAMANHWPFVITLSKLLQSVATSCSTVMWEWSRTYAPLFSRPSFTSLQALTAGALPRAWDQERGDQHGKHSCEQK